MATIKLGAIVTDIAGSVGGSTFRRGSNFIALYNKQRRQIKSVASPFSRLGALSNVVKTWSYMEQTDRDSWELIAGNYRFPSKFGENKILTARQLFTKLNGQLLPAGTINLNATGISDTVTIPLIDNVYSDIESSVIELNFVSAINDAYTYFKFTRLSNLAQQYIPPSRRYDLVVSMGGDDTYNLFYAINEKYQSIEPGEIFTIQVYNCNNFGFTTAVQQITFIAV
jgi:hypothetical protein